MRVCVKGNDLEVLLINFRDESVMYAAKMWANISNPAVAVDCNVQFVREWRVGDESCVSAQCEDV